MIPRCRWTLAVTLSSLLGCASTVDGVALAPDGGNAPADGGACAQWVLTDREEGTGGEIYTDLHLTFDAAGQLTLRRENIRTGGHGKNRTYRELRYTWSSPGLTIEQDGDPAERVVYVLDGERVMETSRASAMAALRQTVRFERDAAGRVVGRIETRGSSATPVRCGYAYDTAGHVVEVACTDGELSRFQWEGERPVRRDRTWRGMSRGFDTWQWDARGALVRESRDDGYGAGRLYRSDHTYDDAGRIVRSESVLGTPPTQRPTAAYAYDERGRLVREERGYDVMGVARSVVRWERDEEGRIAARVAEEGGAALRYAYAVSPGRVEVTTTSGEWRSWRRYQCFSTPVRVVPADPTPGVRIASVIPEAGSFPPDPLEP
jgi:YD repeat-containing protein